MPKFNVIIEATYRLILDTDEFERDEIDELRDKDGKIDIPTLNQFIEGCVETGAIDLPEEADDTEVTSVAATPVAVTTDVS